MHSLFRRTSPAPRGQLTLLAAVSLLAVSSAAPGSGFEQPNPLRSADYLAAGELAGPDFKVEPQATTDGLGSTYTLTSRFGTWTARGRMQVAMRIREIQALAQLEEVSKSEVFKDAVKSSVTAPLELVQAVATKPVETLKGIPDGVGRWMKKTSFQVKEGYHDAKELRAGEKDAGAEGTAGEKAEPHREGQGRSEEVHPQLPEDHRRRARLVCQARRRPLHRQRSTPQSRDQRGAGPGADQFRHEVRRHAVDPRRSRSPQDHGPGLEDRSLGAASGEPQEAPRRRPLRGDGAPVRGQRGTQPEPADGAHCRASTSSPASPVARR